MSYSSSVNTKDVQALFRGFGLKWPHARFFYCRYANGEAGRRLLQFLSPLTSYHDLSNSPDVCVNAAFTFGGIAALNLDNDIINSLPDDFRDGMRSRANINGDSGESDPCHWEEIWREDNVHLWIGAYAREQASLEGWSEKLLRFLDAESDLSCLGRQDAGRIVSSPETPIYIDDVETQPQESVVLEHFGFRDGVSNPPISGLVEKRVKGAGILDANGNWHAYPPGEFLLGHIDTNGEIPVAPKPAAFAQNGSFMVLRKLDQDVDLFRDYLVEQSAKLAMGPDDLAARMVGRRRDGTPLMPSDDLNDFRFSGDPEGRVCPMGSHIRRTNPRDSFGADFGSLLVDRHRILRRAITYGNLVPRGQKQEDVNGPAGQGLIFIVLNASISRQFEFVQQQWVNYGNEFDQGNDGDPIIGTRTGGDQMVIPGDAEEGRDAAICNELKQFVRCRGGDYFFLPGIGAFEGLADNSQGWQ